MHLTHFIYVFRSAGAAGSERAVMGSDEGADGAAPPALTLPLHSTIRALQLKNGLRYVRNDAVRPCAGRRTPSFACACGVLSLFMKRQVDATWKPPSTGFPCHLCNRHGDYQRYRHYTTRRLRRLRRHVKATHHAKGRTLTIKPLTMEAVGGAEKLRLVR